MRNFTSQLCTSFRIIYASIQVAIEVVSVQIANAKLEIVIWLRRMDASSQVNQNDSNICDFWDLTNSSSNLCLC